MRLLADSISKSYGPNRVLTSARLAATEGCVVGVLGRMGCGKSTLLRIAGGIVSADSGWVEIDGKRFIRPGRTTMARRGLFFLGENDNLAWRLTVRQHFDEIARRFGTHPDADTLEMLGIASLWDLRAHQLSGGESKCVEMALAVARNPSVLLADEIMRSADPIIRDQLGLSMRILAERGCAVVVTGHEVGFLMPFLDSVTWVTSGTTYDLGSPESAYANDRFSGEYLGAAR